MWLRHLEHCPIYRKVVGLIPGQGTYLGFGFDPQSGHIQEGNQLMFLSHISVSLFSLPLPLKTVKKCSQVRIKRKELVVDRSLFLKNRSFSKQRHEVQRCGDRGEIGVCGELRVVPPVCVGGGGKTGSESGCRW